MLVCCARARLGKKVLITSRNYGMGCRLEDTGGFGVWFGGFFFFTRKHGREKKTGFRSKLERLRCWGFFYLVREYGIQPPISFFVFPCFSFSFSFYIFVYISLKFRCRVGDGRNKYSMRIHTQFILQKGGRGGR